MDDLENISNQFFIKGTLDEPFKFFEDLIFEDSFNKVQESFYSQTNITKGYRLIIERNGKFCHEAWHKKDDLSDIIDYNGHFIKVLKYSAKIAFKCLEEKLNDIAIDDKKAFITSQLNLLVSCLDKNRIDIESKSHEFVEQEVFNIISSIRIKYFYLITNHKAFTRVLMNSDSINSVFQPKPKLKRQFFVDLHNLAIDLDLIDDIEVEEDVFLDVFTSKKQQHKSRIVFIKTNLIIAHFLKEIEPFFNNFNGVSIERSNLFYNKQGKVLKSTDLYTALSRGKGKNIDELNRISSSINELKSVHLS